MTKPEKIMEHLLSLYDWHIRCINLDYKDDVNYFYQCGTADAIGQCILDIGKIMGEGYPPPYKTEAYRRVMEFESVEKYKLKYPVPISDLQDGKR